MEDVPGSNEKADTGKNGPMAEKGSQNRNSDASFGKIFRFRAGIFVEILCILFSSTGSRSIEVKIGACTESTVGD